MPRPTRACFTNIDCCKATLIDAELGNRILNETSERFAVRLAKTTLFSRVVEDGDFPSPALSPSSALVTTQAVCHPRQACACQNPRLHGDFI